MFSSSSCSSHLTMFICFCALLCMSLVSTLNKMLLKFYYFYISRHRNSVVCTKRWYRAIILVNDERVNKRQTAVIFKLAACLVNKNHIQKLCFYFISVWKLIFFLFSILFVLFFLFLFFCLSRLFSRLLMPMINIHFPFS